MTTLAQLLDCHSCNDERSIVQKKNLHEMKSTTIVECWGQRVRHLALVIHIAPSHGKGNSAQPENLMLPKIPEAAQWWS